MADFQITVPGSGSFKVTAPDADTAYSTLMEHLGSAGPAAAPVASPGQGPATVAQPNGPYTDPVTGEVHNIVGGDQLRGPNDWTQADVDSRTAFLQANPAGKNTASGILGHPALTAKTGQMLSTASSPEDLATAAKDPAFDARVLSNAPDGQRRLAAALLGQQRAGGDGALTTGVHSTVNTAMLGVPDALDAAASPLGYQTERAIQKAEYDKAEENHPIASKVGTVAGTLAQAAVAPEALFASPFRSGVTAAAQSGLNDAITNDRDLTSKQGWQDVGTAALTGGLTGFAASHLLGAGDQAAANAQAEQARLGQLGLDSKSEAAMRGAAERDGTLGPRGLANIQSGGDQAMVADAGPGMKNILDAGTQRGVNALQTEDALTNRARQATTDMTGALDQSLGQPFGVRAAETGIREASAPARKAAYEAAYNVPIDYSTGAYGSQLLDILHNRVPPSAIAEANSLMRIEGEGSRQMLVQLDQHGNVAGLRSLPDVRQWDYITRALRAQADASATAGQLGGQTQRGRALLDLLHDTRGVLRQMVPEYGNALDTAADVISARSMLRLGESALSGSMTTSDLMHEMASATQAERQAAMQGVRSQLQHQLGEVERTITDPDVYARQGQKILRELSSDNAQQKIRVIMGPENRQAADQLFRQIQQQAAAFELKASQIRNSATFNRAATNSEIEAHAKPGLVSELGGQVAEALPFAAIEPSAGLAKLGHGILHTIKGRLPGAETRANAATNDIYRQITDALIKHRGQGAQDFWNTLSTPALGVNAPAIGSVPTRAVIQSLLARGAAGLARP